MSLTTRVITWDFTDAGQDAQRGSVTIAPSQVLTDPSDTVIITTSPQTWEYTGSAGSTGTGLITTDNTGIQQLGSWYYTVTVQWGSQPEWTVQVLLPSGSGSIDLSSLPTPVASAGLGGYLPTSGGALSGPLLLDGSPPLKLPSGTSGYVLTSDGSGDITLQPSAGGGGGGGDVDSVFGRTGTVTAASGDYTVSQVTGAAPLASPALTGTPTAPTATALTSSTQVATTAYADSAVAAETSRAETAEALKAPLASPALTGSPTVPTQTSTDNSTKAASTAYVTTAVATETTRATTAEALALPKAGGTMSGPIAMGGSKVTGAGNASASGDLVAYGQLGTAAFQPSSAFDASGAATTAQGTAETFATSAVATETSRAETAEALLAPKASPALTGTPTAPTASALTDTTQIATTAYADSAVGVEKTRALAAEALLAPLASPALTGSPTAPTQTTGDSSAKIATDAFVATAAASAQAAAIAAALPALVTSAVSASGTLAVNTVTTVTAATALTMTLPTSVAGALIVVERESASTANVAVTGSIRGVGSSTITLQLSSESEMLLGYGGSWWPIAGHKTLSSLQALFLSSSGGTVAGSVTVGGALTTTPVVLTDAATVTVNAALSDFFRVTLGGSRTLGNPSNPTDGQQITVEVIQPASGGPYTLSYGTAYLFTASTPQPSLSTTASDRDLISFVYDAGVSQWICTGYVIQQYGALVTIAQGGTGQTTQQAAINALTGTQTSGYYLRSNGTNAALSAIQVADVPTLNQNTSGTAAGLSATLAIGSGGTGQTGATAAYNALSPMTTLGDLVYENSTPAGARLAGNTSATKNFLTQTGTGSVSAAPAWGTIAAADMPTGTTSAKGALQLDGTVADILPSGTQTVGANGKPADSGHIHPSNHITPADHGLLAWSHDIDANPQGFTLTAGTVYLVKIPIRYALTATYLWFSATAAGTGASTGTYVGLYNSSGTLLTGSSDFASTVTYSGNWQIALTTPQSLTGGTFVWAAILSNQASTQLALRSPYSYAFAATPNLNLTAANYRIAVPSGGTSRTTLQSSFTPSSNSGAGAQLWFGIS